MKLKTNRLIIRDYIALDLDIIHKLVKDRDIYKFQHWGPNTYEDSKNYIEMCLSGQKENPRKSFELCITDKETHEVLGAIGIRIQSIQNKKADLGYWLKRDLWGKGLITEATKEIIRFGFDDLGMQRIYATADPRNLASLKVLQKSGMVKEGILKSDMIVRGETRDSVLMAILKDS